MIEESVAHVRRRAAATAWTRLLLALVANRMARRGRAHRQRHLDRMSVHMLKDMGLSRRDAERNEADWRRLV
jgi:uncharacterized protein YjiS (DUF1127 family)